MLFASELLSAIPLAFSVFNLFLDVALCDQLPFSLMRVASQPCHFGRFGVRVDSVNVFY